MTLPFLFWRVSLAALTSCDPGEAGVSRGGPVGEQLMLNGGWSSPATHCKTNAAALRLVFLYLLHMDNVPQRRGQNLLPANLTIFSSAKICKICSKAHPDPANRWCRPERARAREGRRARFSPSCAGAYLAYKRATT